MLRVLIQDPVPQLKKLLIHEKNRFEQNSNRRFFVIFKNALGCEAAGHNETKQKQLLKLY